MSEDPQDIVQGVGVQFQEHERLERSSERVAAASTARREKPRLFGRRRAALSPAEALHPEAAPPPPPDRRKRPALEAISGFLTFLLVLAVLAGLGVVYASHSVRLPGPLKNDRAVVIAPGSDSDQIIQQLQDQGVIDSPLLFTLALFVEGDRGKLKAGEYLFKQSASLQDVIDTIVQGRAILHSLTIPEGLTSQQIVDRLRADDVLSGEIAEIPREGSLLPETYKFQRGDSRQKLVQKMARAQMQLLDEIWRRRSPDLPLASPFQLVTLASLVEKETGKADERPRVAGVFINRLRKHMRLQSDPTIVYGLVGGQGPLGRPLTHADVETPSPYNTYLVDGLPPGPIANPGRAALEAAANPSRTRELYFVADGTGGHVFSDSLDSHNRNVQKLRQLELNNKSKAPPAALPNHDDHGELAPSPFGAAPFATEFLAGRSSGALERASLRPDPEMIARVAPVLPGATEAPVGVTDLAIFRRRAPLLANDGLADERLGGATEAEDNLDGPADDGFGSGKASARAASAHGGADLDGPAPPVDATPLAYSAGPAEMTNLAPNGKPRIIDASQGTALDPLLDKSWDLNSSKTVDLSVPKPVSSSASRN